MRRVAVILISIMLLLLLVGCNGSENGAEKNEEVINVVTTIYPLSDIISQLGGDKVRVTYLLPAGASPHTYEPTVEQAKLIDQAQLFVYNGAGLDDWAVNLAEASDSELMILDLSEKVALIDSTGNRLLDLADIDLCNEHHDEDNGNAGDCDHDHGPVDPHFWLDPVLVRDSLCPAVSKELVKLSPGHEEDFTMMLKQYQQELSSLDEEITAAVSSFSRDRFLSFHSAWRYFSQRYGLHEVGVIAEFPGQEPSVGWLAELVQLIESEDIGAIFAEPQFSSALAERIAEESGAKVLVLDPLGGESLPGRDSYIDLIRYNLSVFREALE